MWRIKWLLLVPWGITAVAFHTFEIGTAAFCLIMSIFLTLLAGMVYICDPLQHEWHKKP